MKMDSGRHVPLIPEEYLSFVNQSISGGIVCLFPDADCTVYFINDSMLAMLGYTREEFFSETQGCFVQLIHPDDRAAAYAYVEKILAHGGDTCRRYRLITRAGEALWIRDTARPLLTSDGQHLLCCLCVDVTGETRLQRQLELEKECLRISEESYRIAVSHSSKLVHRYYVPTHTILFDPASTTLLGLPERVENVPESLVQAGRVAPESVAEYVAFYDRINAGEPTGRCVVNFRKKDGIYAWFLLDDTLVYDEAKHPLYAIVSYEDITDSRERELAYEKCQQAFSSMPPESIIYYEFNLTRNLCEREEGALVYHLFDQFKGSWTDMISYGATCFTFEEDRTMFREFFNREHLLTAFSTGETGATLDYRILGERNRPKWVHATLQMVRYPYSTDVKAYLLVEDIDIRKRNELRLQTLSQEDALTGVLNRAALVEKVTALLTRKTSHMSHAVMMLDLDGFKNINDCLGHMEGDRVLIEVARRLRTLLRANDIIGRIGGDELMVCLENIPSDVVADKRAHLMCQAICQKLGGNINLSASLGIALCPRDGTDFDTLYNHADLALYCAKRQGGNCHVFYQPEECLTPSAGHDPVTAPDHDPVLNKEKKKCHSNVLLGDEERYRILTQYANGGTFSLDLTTGQFSSSESLTDYCLDGEDLEALLQGRFDSDWVHPQDQKEVMSGLMRRLQNGVARTQVTVRLKKSDGSYDWCHLTTICLRNNEGLLQRIVGALAHVEYAQENAQIQLDTLRRLIDGGCLLLEVGDSIRQIASSAGYQKLVDGTSEYQDSRAQNGRAIFASDLPRLLHSLRDAAQTNGMVECVYRCYALQGQRLDWRRLRAMRMPFQQTDHPVLIAIVTDATPFKKQEECLNLTRKHLNGILEMSKLTAFDVDLDTHTLTRSPETVAQFGVDRLMMDDNPDSLIRSGVIHSDSAEAFCTLHHDIYARIPQGECMVKARKADGHYVSLQISYQGILDDSGRMRRAFGMAKETDNVTRAQLRFAREEKLWAMPGEDLVLTARINLSRSRVEASQINPRYLAAAHLPDQYEQLRQWVLTCVPDAQERARTMQRLSIAALKQRDRSGRDCAALELRHLDANGRLFWASLDVQLLTNPDNGDLYAFFYLRDIDARKMMELDLAVRIKRDRVCQVYDRETMLAMANATSLASQVAVIAMELADACLLRERLGTTKTDQLLALSARKLRMSLPTQCLIGAMGKGSFAILTTNVSSREHVEATVRRMLQILKSPALLLEPEEASLNFRVGIALSESSKSSFDVLYANAVQAAQSLRGQNSAMCFYDGKPSLMQRQLPLEYGPPMPKLSDAYQLLCGLDCAASKAFMQCVSTLLNVHTLDNAMMRILQHMGEYYHAARTYLLELGTNANHVLICHVYEWCAPGVKPALAKLQCVPLEEFPLLHKAFCNHRPLLVHDVKALRMSDAQGRLRFLQERDMDSTYCVPFSSDGMWPGLVGMDDPSLHRENSRFLDVIAYFILNEMQKYHAMEQDACRHRYDALTGLLNRESFVQYCSATHPESLASLGVLTIELQGLHEINGHFGHHYGDRLLIHAAKALRHFFVLDEAYRYEGGTFLVLCDGISRNVFLRQAQGLRDELEASHPGVFVMGFLWSDLVSSVETQVVRAREVMMAIKRKAPCNASTPAFFSAQRADCFHQLQRMLDGGCLKVYLQPKAVIATGEIRGAEALSRIVGPDNTILMPGHFIPQLEQQGLIRHVDFFVLQEICRALARWKHAGRQLMPISLNFSLSTLLEPDVVGTICALTDQYEVERRLIEIEITQSVGEKEWDTIVSVGKRITQEGFGLSLDNFGCSHSNLTVLSSLDFSSLKLDKGLIDQLASSPKSCIMLTGILTILQQSSIRSIAKGVETQEQLDKLRELGCQCAQGYLFNKPIPLQNFENEYILEAAHA